MSLGDGRPSSLSAAHGPGPEPDPFRSQILAHEFDREARLRLVAAERCVPLATGIGERAAILGQPHDGSMECHEPLTPRATRRSIAP